MDTFDPLGDLGQASIEADHELLRRRVHGLTRALDALLPVARAHMAVPAEHGGPAHDDLVDDPDASGVKTLPEILTAERLLFEEDAQPWDGMEDCVLDLSELTDQSFQETRPDRDDDPQVAAAREFLWLHDSINARRIAKMPVEDDLLEELVRARSNLIQVILQHNGELPAES